MELTENILWLLKQAFYFSLTSVNGAISEHGVSTAQIGVLRQLSNEPGLSGAELARRLLISPQGVQLALTTLEHRGLVERKQDPQHKRILQAFLTDEGREVVTTVLNDALAAHGRVFGVLDAGEQETLRELLSRIVEKGMGEATCHELGRRGLKVAVLDVNEQAAGRVTEELQAGGTTAIGVGADVTDRAAVERAFAKVRSELGPVSVLVTSAGMFGHAPFTEITAQSWARIIDVNLTGTFHCCQVAIPDMVAAKWGRIVMISSSSAQRGSPFAAHYAASKGAVITLTKSLAREYAAHGITVNNIPPSGIETPMQQQAQAAGFVKSNEAIARNIPMGHLGTGADIAAAVGFLCSDEAGFITGQVLGVNGGAVM